LDDAHELVDKAISTSIAQSKPVYISISCNLAAIPHPNFKSVPLPYSMTQGPDPRKLFGIGNLTTNKLSLEAAVETVAELLNNSVKPVLVAGPKLRFSKANEAFEALATACGYATAIMPSAKGQFPENHPNFIGTYWGAVSSVYTAEIVESSDKYLFAGPVFNDYSSVGYSLLIKKDNLISLEPDRVKIGNGPSFGCVLMKDFLEALVKKIKKNTTSFDNYSRMYVPQSVPLKQKQNEPLKTVNLFKHIQGMLTKDSAVIAETGDSWFNCQKLKLPEGCTYEFQMQYGSIGWAVGATLGYAQGNKAKRVIACIGDGSFQVTAQDVSTMIRYGQKSIIFLLNNGGYTIEVEIHDGPYNIIKNWNYTALVEAFANCEGNVWTCKVRTEEELEEAIAATHTKADSLCFIEVILHKDDTSKELLEWGSRVATANSRPPNPQ
jgi:pyruvate decarboxylase